MSHEAIVTLGPGLPLEKRTIQTPTPLANEIRIKVQWTASSPLDLWQADGGLLVNPPHIMGSSIAGTIVEVGDEVRELSVGDEVFGYTFRYPKERAHQDFVVTMTNMVAKIPSGFSQSECAATCNNLVTAFHVLRSDCELDLPWPKPEGYRPAKADIPILVWGGSTSVGQYALQLLHWYGYHNILVTASTRHHAKMERYGAKQCFEYADEDVVEKIMDAGARTDSKHISVILDCVGSLEKSVQPVARIAEPNSVVAVMLPVVISEGKRPELTLDAEAAVSWPMGVHVRGVRTHFYQKDEFLAQRLQSEIMPSLISQRIVEPNEQVIVEGPDKLSRANKALEMLRNKSVSGARLVWRVFDE